MRLRLLAATSLVVLAGCATASPTSSASSPSPASPSPASPSPASPSPASPSPAPSSESPSSETLTGRIAAGVEPHCLVLRDAAGLHSIYFHDESLRSSAPAGAQVTLVGHPEPGMMTTCQQGVPFIVTAVRKN